MKEPDWDSEAEAILLRLMLLKVQAWEEQDCEQFKIYYRAERDLRRQLLEEPTGLEE